MYANTAAETFYGYTDDELLSMRISDINMLDPEQTAAEMAAAQREERNYFEFRHQLADGSVRHVEVFSYPVTTEGRTVLFSVIHDVTGAVLLEQRQAQTRTWIFASGGISIALLLLLMLLQRRANRKLRDLNRELDGKDTLRQTFIDADRNLEYLKDENLKYVFVNRAVEEFYDRPASEIIGKDDYEITEAAFADLRRKTDLAAQQRRELVEDEVVWDGRVFATTKFPVPLSDGTTGVGAYIIDITEDRERQRRQEQMFQRQRILSDALMRVEEQPRDLLDYVLHQALELTSSRYGYIYLFDEETKILTLNSWSKDVLDDCAVPQPPITYHLESTGIWGVPVRDRAPLIMNDFAAPDPRKRGYPEGHVALTRFMAVPVVVNGHIVATVGMGNKESDYDDTDVSELILLMTGTWNILQRRAAEQQLTVERNRYRQTLVSIGDGVIMTDTDGRVEMINKVAESLTGWSADEAREKRYTEVLLLSHEQEGKTIADPIAEVLRTGRTQTLSNHAVLTSRDGSRYLLEDSAAPIRDEHQELTGVVMVFRDVTRLRRQREEIDYLNLHDTLTGLYNRRYCEEQMQKLSDPSYLPVSVIIGDVNGLKLTNDIFGHASGDDLLQYAADALRAVSRPQDVAARWGGDEFVMLLPRTGPEEAERMLTRIRETFAKHRVRAIRGSISLGADTRTDGARDMAEVLTNAEEAMYLAKTLDRSESQQQNIHEIVRMFHREHPKEQRHARAVRDICAATGEALGLDPTARRHLADAAYLHDIGKIVLSPELLGRSGALSAEEWYEIRKHPTVGYRILSSFDDTVDLAGAVLAHQEHWDGTGYPKGLKGEEIPLAARIIAIAEGFDRMTRGRTPAGSREKAAAACQAAAGTQYDPELVDLMMPLLLRGADGSPDRNGGYDEDNGSRPD